MSIIQSDGYSEPASPHSITPSGRLVRIGWRLLWRPAAPSFPSPSARGLFMMQWSVRPPCAPCTARAAAQHPPWTPPRVSMSDRSGHPLRCEGSLSNRIFHMTNPPPWRGTPKYQKNQIQKLIFFNHQNSNTIHKSTNLK